MPHDEISREIKPWPLSGRIPQPGERVAVEDGIYAQFQGGQEWRTLACCCGGRVVTSLRKSPSPAVLARFETTADAQNYRMNGQLEDFGGRVEGPAYDARRAFKSWLKEKAREVKASLDPRESSRPVPGMFLNPGPPSLFGRRPAEIASATVPSDGFYPCVLLYDLDREVEDERLLPEVGGLYLQDALIEVSQEGDGRTGFVYPLVYRMILVRAMDEKGDLFLSVFRKDNVVVVGACEYGQRVEAEKGVLGTQKFFLQKRFALASVLD